MPDILIEGGDAGSAAMEIRDAVRDIFEIDPIQSTVGGGPLPGTRGLVEAVTLLLTIPPGIFYGKRLIEDIHFGDRLRRLIVKAETEEKKTGAQLKIVLDDGKVIPLHQANHDQIREALAALEQQHKKS
jgi:hypothetical protein